MATENYFSADNINIRTKITGDKEKAIVFVHGNSCSADFWDEQVSDITLQEHYKLIAFDLPGHGKSGMHDSYSIKKLALIIPELIEQLQLDNYIIAGLSFGTCLIAEAAPFLKGCEGFFLGSSNITNDEHPPASYIVPFAEGYALASPSVTDEVLTKFAEELVLNTSSSLVRKYKESYLHTDPSFRTALSKTIMENDWSDEFANLLNTKLPTCFVFGKQEKMVHTNYLDDYPSKWNDKIYKIEGAAHFINNEQPQAFNKLLLQFADDCFK